MIRKKLKWYLLFEDVQLLHELLGHRSTVVHQSMHGSVLFVRNGEELLAFKNRCPHQNKPMNGAWVSDGQVVCPFHRYHFSCETGRGHGLCLHKYGLKIEEERVYLGKEVWSFF